MAGVLEFLFGPLRDKLYASYFKKLEKQKEICREAYERINKERQNFEHIVAKKGYNSEAHRKAVEQSSFELLLVAMEKLQNVRKFSRPAKLVIARIKIKDAAGVLEEINKLEPRLEKAAGS